MHPGDNAENPQHRKMIQVGCPAKASEVNPEKVRRSPSVRRPALPCVRRPTSPRRSRGFPPEHLRDRAVSDRDQGGAAYGPAGCLRPLHPGGRPSSGPGPRGAGPTRPRRVRPRASSATVVLLLMEASAGMRPRSFRISWLWYRVMAGASWPVTLIPSMLSAIRSLPVTTSAASAGPGSAAAGSAGQVSNIAPEYAYPRSSRRKGREPLMPAVTGFGQISEHASPLLACPANGHPRYAHAGAGMLTVAAAVGAEAFFPGCRHGRWRRGRKSGASNRLTWVLIVGLDGHRSTPERSLCRAGADCGPGERHRPVV